MKHKSQIRKNILDLHFQKHLIIMSTSIIIIFTYLIAITISIITKQVKLNEPTSATTLIILSLIILYSSLTIFYNSLFHINNITKVLKQIKK